MENLTVTATKQVAGFTGKYDSNGIVTIGLVKVDPLCVISWPD